jgi:hypothetical protein
MFKQEKLLIEKLCRIQNTRTAWEPATIQKNRFIFLPLSQIQLPISFSLSLSLSSVPHFHYF